MDGYCYNSDTLFLFDFISKCDPKGFLLDVGCGCGVLGLLLKRDFPVDLYQIDKQEHNIELTKKNGSVNNLETDVLSGDFLEHDFDKRFDFVISNPPYYCSNTKMSSNESLKISRYNENLPIELFFKKVNSILRPKGEFVFCYDASQFEDVIFWLKSCKIKIEQMRFVHSKAGSEASLVMIRGKKSSNASVKCLYPLIVHENGCFSQEANDIFKRAGLNSIKCKVQES